MRDARHVGRRRWRKQNRMPFLMGFFNGKLAECDFRMHEVFCYTFEANGKLGAQWIDRWKYEWIWMHGKWQMACNQMIEPTKNETNSGKRCLSRTHSVAFPIHSTPFNRIFLIYFHYASQACVHDVASMGWQSVLCTRSPCMDSDSTAWSCYRLCPSVAPFNRFTLMRTPTVHTTTSHSLRSHIASFISLKRFHAQLLNLFMVAAIPVCLHLHRANSISHRHRLRSFNRSAKFHLNS